MQAHPSTGARRILIAAQDGINRHIMASVLTDEGHLLAFADDGAKALEMVQHQPFDLVLMDVLLPVMDGLEATRHIRGLPGAERGVPILALSADATAFDREQQAAAGMTGGLSKRFEWDRFIAAIERHALRPSACNTVAQPECGQPETLVDSGVLSRLQARVGPDKLHTMVRMTIDAYDLYCDEMLEADAGPAAITRGAHKIMGSAGKFGLSRISALASQIGDALERNLSVDGVVRQLKVATDRTRDELERMGALAA